jgi:hypothetical protein
MTLYNRQMHRLPQCLARNFTKDSFLSFLDIVLDYVRKAGARDKEAAQEDE